MLGDKSQPFSVYVDYDECSTSDILVDLAYHSDYAPFAYSLVYIGGVLVVPEHHFLSLADLGMHPGHGHIKIIEDTLVPSNIDISAGAGENQGRLYSLISMIFKKNVS